MVVHLCVVCIFNEECPTTEYPVLNCVDFDDGYEGPEYPDGDAYREYRNAELFGGDKWVCMMNTAGYN